MEKRTVLRFGALPKLRPIEQVYVDAFLEGEAACLNPEAELLPMPSDEHLSAASKRRIRVFLAEQTRQIIERWEADTGTPFFLTDDQLKAGKRRKKSVA